MKERTDTIICRCEEVSLSEIYEAIDAGCRSVGAVKRYTRAGMGPCQGRSCGSTIARIIAERCGLEIEAVDADTVRFPTVALGLARLASVDEASSDETGKSEPEGEDEPAKIGQSETPRRGQKRKAVS